MTTSEPPAAAPPLPRDAGLVEVAPGCFGLRSAFVDLTLGVVAGRDGSVVVDSGPTAAHAHALADAVEAAALPPVVAVVNTHVHWDHVLGNATLTARWPDAELVAHEETAAAMTAHLDAFRTAAAGADSPYAGSPHLDGLLTAEPHLPTRTLSSALVLDLGDRLVEVVHPGPAHTAGDVVVHLPDVDLLFAGDLVEQSAPPSYGEDSWPLTWASALDVVVGMLRPGGVVVPGHGDPVLRDTAEEQRDAISAVAATIRDLAGQGVPADRALESATWPFPTSALGEAVRRGYAHLPRGARSLPMA